jgi:hypothetical protein
MVADQLVQSGRRGDPVERLTGASEVLSLMAQGRPAVASAHCGTDGRDPRARHLHQLGRENADDHRVAAVASSG